MKQWFSDFEQQTIPDHDHRKQGNTRAAPYSCSVCFLEKVSGLQHSEGKFSQARGLTGGDSHWSLETQRLLGIVGQGLWNEGIAHGKRTPEVCKRAPESLAECCDLCIFAVRLQEAGERTPESSKPRTMPRAHEGLGVVFTPASVKRPCRIQGVRHKPW